MISAWLIIPAVAVGALIGIMLIALTSANRQ